VKPIKMFGLAALAALMAMAFVGASSAMAETTTLCESDPSVLAESCSISHVHETSVTKGKLLAGSITVECDVLFLGEVGAAGAPQVITGNFTYTNCGSCSATEENGPAEIQVLKTGHETSSVTGEGLVHVNCSGLNCRYNGEGLVGTGKGPLLSAESRPNGEVSISEKSTAKESGLFCPTTSKLDLTTTPLTPTYIGGNIVHYCVDYPEHEHGFYEAVSELKCTGYDPNAESLYDLVEGPEGYKMGDMVCVNMNVSENGLYKEAASIIECKGDNKLEDLYELGVIA
jgi:hypothetical protein